MSIVVRWISVSGKAHPPAGSISGSGHEGVECMETTESRAESLIEHLEKRQSAPGAQMKVIYL